GGIRMASVEFLQCIRRLTTRHGALFADSVQCGYGRTGTFYSHDYADVSAAIYSMAKGMGNEFLLGGIVISPQIKPWFGMLGTTFIGNHLACAAALAVLEVMQKKELMQNDSKVGRYLIDELQKFDRIVEVRGRGLMIGIELPSEFSTVKKDLLAKNRIFTGEAKPNVIRLLPALNVTRLQADRFLGALKERLAEF